jgi:fructan beta-fructosidase
VDGVLRLRILVDRASLEVFGADGLIALPIGVIPPDYDLTLCLCVKGGPALARALAVYELDSVWRR